jgi:diketogulonate reductase-like aldo/keto reductase
VLDSLAKLQTDYLDLLLIHWPGASKLKQNDQKNVQLRTESWQELEKLHGKNGKKQDLSQGNHPYLNR